MVKKQDNGFDPRPPSTSDAGPSPIIGVEDPRPRKHEATPSGVKLAAAAVARPPAVPRASGTSGIGLARDETLPKHGAPKVEGPHKSGVAASELGRGGAARPSPRRAPPERPELSASDVEWWAESALNATFEPSRVVPIEDTTDPNEGDRITPVFLESITPVFPESKVREVMALADARERSQSAKGNLPATVRPPPPIIQAPPAPPAPPLARPSPLEVEPEPDRGMAGAGIWNVPVLDAPASRAPSAPASDVASGARPVLPKPSLPEAGTLSFGRARPPSSSPSPSPSPNGPNPDSSDQLHAVSFASAGADVSMAIWIAMGIVIVMAAAAMFTVG